MLSSTNYHSVWEQAPGLGRLVSSDPRDRKFLMRELAPPPKVTKMFWDIPNILDQGSTNECTSYSAEYLLLCGPVKNQMYKTPHDLYLENQKNDEWFPTPHEGSSVRAAMKVLQAAGYLFNYVWAFNARDAANWVLTKGPVVFGIDWYSEMFKPNTRTGFIRARGTVQGGHAICCRGYDDRLLCPDGSRGAFRLINSWGIDYGQKGLVWISFKDMDKLIKQNGEAASPSEILKV